MIIRISITLDSLHRTVGVVVTSSSYSTITTNNGLGKIPKIRMLYGGIMLHISMLECPIGIHMVPSLQWGQTIWMLLLHLLLLLLLLLLVGVWMDVLVVNVLVRMLFLVHPMLV